MTKIALVALIATSIFPLTTTGVAQAAAPNWNTTGNYVVRFVLGGDYDYDVTLNQDGLGNLTGNGTYPAGGPTTYAWTITSGTVSGDAIDFYANYTAAADAVTPLTTMHVTGTIALGGTMSGTWTDNYQGGNRAGTWSTVSGNAAPIVTSNVDVVVRPSTLSFPGGWYFYDDVSDTPHPNTSTGHYDMVSGPATPPKGDASVQMTVTGSERTNIATAQFAGTDLSAIGDMKFSTYQPSTNPGSLTKAIYLNFDVDFDNTVPSAYQGRLVFVPSDNGSVSQDSWQEWDAYAGQWRWSKFISNGNAWPDGNTSELRSWSDIVASFPKSEILATYGQLLFRAGEPYPDGFTGNVDKFVFKTGTTTTTYDFEQDIPRTPADIVILKEWQDSEGNVVDAPSNKDDININVMTSDENSTSCSYDVEGFFNCEDPISTYTDETIVVEETGVPAGWEVDPTTVGNSITPVCPQEITEEMKVVECTHTVVNKMKAAVPCNIELVTNGSFENPEVTNESEWQLFPSGTDGLGWSVDNRGTDTNGNMELQSGVLGNAHTGLQIAELDSDQSVSIYQDLVTKVGGVYTVKLWTSPRPGFDSSTSQTEVRMGDTVLDVISEDGTANNNNSPLVWTEHTYSFTADSTFTRLSITDLGESNGLGGLVDDVSVKQDCLSDVTICKVDQNQNPLSGWTVFLKGSELESVTVPANSVEGVSSESTLENGQDYILVASGTADAGDGIEFDADYSFRTPSSTTWTDSVSTYEGYGDQLLDLKVNGGFVNWDNDADYNTNHIYTYEFTGTGSPVSFAVNDIYSVNNTGNLNVTIYPVIKGITGKGGCVTLKNVPYDGYKLDEIMQPGWTNVEGKGDKTLVDQPEESFTLVNQCIDNCVSNVKICKKDDSGNPLSGWNVFLKGPKLGKTLYLDPSNYEGVNSSAVLEAGMDYEIEISGEWQNRGFETVDASFTTPDGWDTVLAGPQGGFPDDLLETQINNQFVNWGPYSGEPDHKYNLTMTGNGSVANFRVFDGDVESNTINTGWYGDNDGKLTIKIYPIYQGVTTGEDGCVTLEDVPFGNYTLGEVMQEGWVNVSGNGTDVIVNEPSEPGINAEENPFVLVNACDSESCQEPVPCTVEPILVSSGAATFFEGLKEGGEAPVELNNPAYYPGGTTGGAQPAAPTGYDGAWDGSAIPGAVYVSNDSTQPTFTGGAGHDGSVDSWRLFSHTFTIPDGAVGINTPVLHFAADNEVSVYLDDEFIGFSNSFSTITDSSPLVLTPGTHTFKFAVKNYAFDQTNNPTGVIYKLDDITYSCDNGGEGDLETVSGLVYNDANQNGNQDEGEDPIEGLEIKLIAVSDNAESTELDETEVGSDTSDVNGLYEFTDVAPGCYIVREIPVGYTQTEPEVSNHEYYISVGGAICDFDNSESSKLSSLFFKTASAAQDSTVFVAYTGQSLSFGNVAIKKGGGGGSGSGGSPLNPQVLGDSTDVPSVSPDGQVLGASTTLPRTGSPLWVLFVLIMAAAPVYYFKGLADKASSK